MPEWPNGLGWGPSGLVPARVRTSSPALKKNEKNKLRKGPTNIELRKLISELNKKKEKIWKRVASELARPTRQRRAVNLTRIEKNIRNGEIALVPGKVLGTGNLTKKITISAFQFSTTAKDKIKTAGGNIIPIIELIKKYKKGMKVRIIG